MARRQSASRRSWMIQKFVLYMVHLLSVHIAFNHPIFSCVLVTVYTIYKHFSSGDGDRLAEAGCSQG